MKDITAGLPRILCVDDDENILDGFQRHLRKKFRVYTATGANEGLKAVIDAGPFPVVVSDYKMPGMNGIQFLAQVRGLAPDSVRIMLTGQTDFATAIAAVNQGNIFRFLVKPCAPMILEKILESGLDQHRLITAERQLTQETLLGCLQVLVEVLSIVRPDAFGRASRVRRYVRHVVEALELPDAWQFEAAAMLSQVGWITLPPQVFEKAIAGQAMSAIEKEHFLGHAHSAARILEKVPRLDGVARIIEKHNTPFRDLPSHPTLALIDFESLGSQILNAAIDFDTLRQEDQKHAHAIAKMESFPGTYMPEVLKALATIEEAEALEKVVAIPALHLSSGMILEEDLLNDVGLVLLGKGQEVTSTFAQRLSKFNYGVANGQQCRVRVPRQPEVVSEGGR
jgi:ActR/RegA family two-component response regulator